MHKKEEKNNEERREEKRRARKSEKRGVKEASEHNWTAERRGTEYIGGSEGRHDGK